MRILLIFVSAVILGLGGGYAWSKWPASTSDHSPMRKSSGTVAAVYYADCAAARAAGAGDLFVGLPGYRTELDSNGDGVACSSGDAGS